MKNKTQQRQCAEKQALLASRMNRRRLVKAGFILASSIPLPDTDATEIDLFADVGHGIGVKRVGRALRQSSGGWAYVCCPFGLVPAETFAHACGLAEKAVDQECAVEAPCQSNE